MENRYPGLMLEVRALSSVSAASVPLACPSPVTCGTATVIQLMACTFPPQAWVVTWPVAGVPGLAGSSALRFWVLSE